MLQKFGLVSIIEMDDGRIREAVEQEMKRAELDCKDRPATEKPRVVTLGVNFTPVCHPDGSLASIEVSFDINGKLPARKSATYNMAAERGGLFFNDLSKDEVRQATLDQVPQPKGAPNAG